MKKSIKTTVVSNIILVITIVSVFLVSFVPEKIIPIYGGSSISAIYNGNRENRKVSLMFNVYENTEIVLDIVDKLNEYNAKATFFIGGCWADDNEKALLELKNSGHEIANHGYFHKDHSKLDYEKNKEEIFLTEKVIYALCGEKTTLFAPPSGSFSNYTLEASYDLGYKVIMWSKDTIDWRDNNSDLIFSRATKNINNGDLILMHPKPQTLLALSKILEYYRSNNFIVTTVSDNLL